jgi:hypothetical protein
MPRTWKVPTGKTDNNDYDSREPLSPTRSPGAKMTDAFGWRKDRGLWKWGEYSCCSANTFAGCYTRGLVAIGKKMLKLCALFLLFFASSCPAWADGSKETLYLLDKTGTEIKSLPMAITGEFSESSAEFALLISPGHFISGIIDRNGDFILPPEHKACDSFHEGLAWVVKADGKSGYIRRDGSWAFTVPDGFYGRSFSEGLAVVELLGKSGYFDSTGTLVISPQFSGASAFHDGLAAVWSGYLQWHFIDKRGHQIGGNFAYAGDFSEGLGPVDTIGPGCCGYHGPTDDYKGAGFMDTQGRLAVTPEYNQVCSFSDGMAAVRKDRKWGFVDKSGRKVISPSFESVRNFSDGLCPVRAQASDKWGYINKQGEFVIPPQFQQAEPMSEGLAKVQINGKFGFVDKTGRFVIEPKYSWCRNFQCERTFATR